MANVRDEAECDPDDQAYHGQSRTAKTRTEEYEPTVDKDESFWRIGNEHRSRKPYLNFQQVITTNAFVVHFMVRIISITAAFVLDEGKSRIDISTEPDALSSLGENLQATRCSSRGWDVTPDKATVSVGVRTKCDMKTWGRTILNRHTKKHQERWTASCR